MLSLSEHLLKHAMDLREKAAQDAEALCRIAEELEDIADVV